MEYRKRKEKEAAEAEAKLIADMRKLVRDRIWTLSVLYKESSPIWLDNYVAEILEMCSNNVLKLTSVLDAVEDLFEQRRKCGE